MNTLLKQPLLFMLLSILVSGCTGIPDGVEPVRPFDIQRYKGEWFEIGERSSDGATWIKFCEMTLQKVQ